MEIRNVQRTGNMHYVYLPTNWCKKNNVTSDSKVYLETQSDGKLVLSTDRKEPEKKHLELKVDEEDSEILHKLIVASYINPLQSFKILLNKELNMAKILDQKKLISIESVELEGKSITCESNITVSDPLATLKTMVNKIKNLLIILKDNYNMELVERYEEEIDRSKLLIDKAIIGFFTNNQPLEQKPIDMYYVSIIAKDLERMVDHLIQLEDEKDFLDQVHNSIVLMKRIIDEPERMDYLEVIKFIKTIIKMTEPKKSDRSYYLKKRIRQYFVNIGEVLLDYAITKKIE